MLWTAACVLGLACAPAAANAAAVDPAWFPLALRSEWLYETHRDQTLHPDKASISRTLHVGRTLLTTEPGPERVKNSVLVSEKTELKPVEGEAISESLAGWTVYTLDGELRIHASSESQADGRLGEVVYDPPLRLLAATAVGESWNAGTFRNGAQSAKVRGEVLGTEDVAAAQGDQRWTGCLKVRLSGPLNGSVPQAQQQGDIESGEYERLLWFARDVGIVRDVTTLSLNVRLPEDRRLRLVEVLSLRLIEHRSAQ
jgi:hypothetical protein